MFSCNKIYYLSLWLVGGGTYLSLWLVVIQEICFCLTNDRLVIWESESFITKFGFALICQMFY